MHQRRFIKLNCMITLIAFLISLFSANLAFIGNAYAETSDSSQLTGGIWNVKTAKGEYSASGSGGYEKWADGKQRFVLRDALGHLMSWGEAKVEKLTGGNVKVTVKDSEGTFEATKLSNSVSSAAADTAAATEISSEAAASSASSAAAKSTIGQKLMALKEKVTTPIATGGKGSSSWEKGYNFGKDAPTNLVNKVKSVFSKNGSQASPSASETTSASSSTPATSPASSSTSVDAATSVPTSFDAQVQPSSSSAQPSVSANTAAAPETSVKSTISQKLSALKETVTTPIETGGKGSSAWEKGYNVGKDAPTNLVNKVKSVFSKSDTTQAFPSVSETANASTPASSSTASNTAKSASPSADMQVQAQAQPSVSANTATAPETSVKSTLGQKLSTLKEAVTTPIETGGKGSTAWEKGYNVGKDAPTKVVDKVKGLFGKSSSSSSAATETSSSSTTAAASETPSASTQVQSSQPSAASVDTAAASAPTVKTTLGQKLMALKEKVTTPIETGGKGSAAWEKGYKFGEETPGKVVGKVKTLFKKTIKTTDTETPAASESLEAKASASVEETPSQKMSDQKNSKVEFNEKTGQFEKAVVPATPSKLSVSLSAGKEALKANFSVKNLALSAGLTVGFKIFEQVKNGESVSIGKAVGYLATGEFAGSFVGSGLGSAAGTVVGTLIGSSVPVVGPIIGALMPAIFGQIGGQIGSNLGNDLASGQTPSFKKAIASIDKVAVLGQAVGSTIGAAVGSLLLPGFGSIIGGLVGGMIANVIVNKIRNRTSANYHISSVNAQSGQVIYNEEVAPPPAQSSVLSNVGVSASGTGEAQSTYDKMISAYKRYSQLLSEGNSESQECQGALAEYKQLYVQYANTLQSQSK